MNGAQMPMPDPSMMVQLGMMPLATSAQGFSGRAAAMSMGLSFTDIIQAMLGGNLSNNETEPQLVPKKLQEEQMSEQFMMQAAQMLIPPAFIQAGIPLISESDLETGQQTAVSQVDSSLFNQGNLTQRLTTLLTNLGYNTNDQEALLTNAKAFLNVVEAQFNTNANATDQQAAFMPVVDQPKDAVPIFPSGEGFSQVIQEVKSNLNTTQEKKPDTGIEQVVSASQQTQETLAPRQIDTAPILKTKADSLSKQYDFLNQVTHGLKQNLGEGKDRFVIKLRPESLGEITVRLVEEGGKSILRIATSNPTTAQLINNDLNALKEAMRPMQIQVETAVSPSQNLSADVSQQFNMANQQFNGQQQRQFTHNGTYHAYQGGNEIDEDSTSELLWPKLTLDGVDRYV